MGSTHDSATRNQVVWPGHAQKQTLLAADWHALCCLCGPRRQHLSNNIFFLYIFGKLVEEDEGIFGVWMTYLVTGCVAGSSSACFRCTAITMPRAHTLTAAARPQLHLCSTQRARAADGLVVIVTAVALRRTLT